MNSKYILNQIIANPDKILFNPHQRDNCSEPYIRFKLKCSELGYKCEGLNNQDIKDCKWVINWEISSIPPKNPLRYLIFWLKMKRAGGSTRNMVKEKASTSTNAKFALMILEPPSVSPTSYEIERHLNFDIIFTWSRDLIQKAKAKDKYVLIKIPQPSHLPFIKINEFDKKKLCVAITSNKNLAKNGSTYSEKIKVLSYFNEKEPDNFSLYGHDWKLGIFKVLFLYMNGNFISLKRFKQYKGTVNNKAEVYSNFKFAICFENSISEDYVSEKIFDCVRYGCIPIYLGAPNICELIHYNIFIDYRKFKNIDELYSFISNISEKEYNNYQQEIRLFLKSIEYEQYLSEHFSNCIIKGLGLE